MTLSTLAIDPARRDVLRHAVLSLSFAVFCAFFGAVYEHFSFGVYSNFMIYAFAFPLAAGAEIWHNVTSQTLKGASLENCKKVHDCDRVFSASGPATCLCDSQMERRERP